MWNNKVDLILITNPFEPTQNPIKDILPYEDGKMLSEYLGDIGGDYIVSVNGKIIDESSYDAITLIPDDLLIVSPIPYGGGDGGGKGILRFVAVVALSYFTVGAGSIFSGLTSSSAINFAASSAAFIGGSMLINQLLPPAVPGQSGASDYKSSPTYGIDGAKNTSQDGLVVPLCFGKYRMAGNIISLFTENINDTQYLYMLLNAGEGPILGISDILINDQPISNFENVQYEVRNGTEDQDIIGWFGEIVRPFSVQAKVTENFRIYKTTEKVDKARFDIVFPSGLSGINEDNGDRYEVSVDFSFQYRVYNPNSGPEDGWNRLPWEDESGNISTDYFRVTGKTASPLRRSVKSGLLPEEVYEFRYRRTTAESNSDFVQDSATMADINEITVEKIRYKHTALLGIKIMLTDQLSSQPKVTFINEGMQVKTYLNDQPVVRPTNNPAWIAYAVLTNPRYGGGIKEEFIRLDKFKEWADWCEDQDLTFDAVLDADTNLFDSLIPVFRAGHAKIVSLGTKISVTIEKPDIPVMMFSNANIIAESFSIDWLSVEDRANEIEVNFFDKTARYQQRSVKVYDEAALARGELQRPNSMTLIGVVDEEKAFYEALLALNVNKYIQQTVTFDAHVDAISCTIGSVVYVQHDMPQWGYSGRIQPESTRSKIHLDYDLSAVAETTPNRIILQRSARMRVSKSIKRIQGNFIYLEANIDNMQIARAIIGGVDYEVFSAVQVGQECRIELDLAGAGYGRVSPGEICQLWEVDVFEEKTISGIDRNVVSIVGEFSFDPEPYSNFLAGRNSTMKKKFRITAIDFNTDHVRTINAIEYNESIYDKDIPWSPGGGDSDLGILRPTEITDITETLVRIGKNLRPKVTVQYTNPSSRYQTSKVYVATNDGEYEYISENRSSVSFESEEGATILIKAVPVDSAGISLSFESVEPVSYFVLGKTAPPTNVKNFKIEKTVGGVQLSWDANVDLDIDSYTVREGDEWSTGKIVAENVSATVLFVPINEPGDFRFMIKAVDTTGNFSEQATAERIFVTRPDRVRNFVTVQHIEKILMEWDRPDDRSVNTFWIREGSQWENSTLVGSVSGTSFELPATSAGERTFWIKAIDLIGLESEIAVFSRTIVHDTGDRNKIFVEYHGKQPDGSTSAPGDKLNCSGSAPIMMDDDVSYAEYTAHVELPYLARARNSADLQVGVFVRNDLVWNDASFPWDSDPANMPWAGTGDPEMVSFKRFISVKRDVDTVFPGTRHFFTLNETLNDSLPTGVVPTPDSNLNVVYDDARYNKGVAVTGTTSVRWKVKEEYHKTTWSTAMWIMFPKEFFGLTTASVAAEVHTTTGKILIIFDPANQKLIARQAGVPDAVITGFYPNPGDFALVGIAQDDKARTIRAKRSGNEFLYKASVDVPTTSLVDKLGIGFS